MNSFIQIRRDLHQIPELGFQEFKTQQYILDYLSKLPQDKLEIMRWETGLLVRVRGSHPKKTIGYRSDMDGLPILEQTGYAFSSIHEGNMHACGHDFHMSIALGILTELVTRQPPENHIVFIFQPAEEGPGGAYPMMQSKEFQKQAFDEIYALHVQPEAPTGYVRMKPGIFFAHTAEIHIDLMGKGGHAAYPHLTKDMIVASAALVQQIQTVISRNINPLESGVVTFGFLHSGTANNIIAQGAKLKGTARALSVETMQVIKKRVSEICQGIAVMYDCEVQCEFRSEYYGVYNDAILTENLLKYFKEENIPAEICEPTLAGEDFGYMIQNIPGCMFWLGVQSPFGLHHEKFCPDEAAIPKAIHFMSKFLSKRTN